MKQITLKDLKNWNACYWECGERIHGKAEYVENNLPATALEVTKWDIPPEDRLWALLRPEVIDKKTLHLLACDFAEDVLHIFEKEYPRDDRPRKAIKAKREWIEGEISDSELKSAQDAAWNAARSAAGAAARSAARAAAWSAAGKRQLEMVIKRITL